MSIQTIIPESEDHWLDLRTKDVTSTEAPALFDVNPHVTQFELHFRKAAGQRQPFEANERTVWGLALQDAIAAEVAKQQGFQIRRATEYLRDDETRMGASFDFEVVGKNCGLEIKNVDSLQFREGWIVNRDQRDEDEELEIGTVDVEAPPHIEIQVQVQMALKGWDANYIGALVGGNQLALIKRTRNLKTIAEITARTKAFWESIAAGQPPPPDFARDSKFICSLYQQATEGEVVDMRNDEQIRQWASEHNELGKQMRAIKLRRDEIKARAYQHIGLASKVLGENFSIDTGITKGGPREFVSPDFRRFRVFYKKGAS